MDIGNRIKQFRENLNISQEELAKRTKKLNQSQICKIESNDRKVKADELIIIAESLKTTIPELLKGDETKDE